MNSALAFKNCYYNPFYLAKGAMVQQLLFGQNELTPVITDCGDILQMIGLFMTFSRYLVCIHHALNGKKSFRSAFCPLVNHMGLTTAELN